MTLEAATAPVDDGSCFGCGPDNPAGLDLQFERDGRGGAAATCILDQKYGGYRGIAHGGIVALLLDEAMAHACGSAGEAVMTAALNVRFREPVKLGMALTLSGWVVSRRRNILKAEAVVRDAAGVTLASAAGSFVSVGSLTDERRGNFAQRQTV